MKPTQAQAFNSRIKLSKKGSGIDEVVSIVSNNSFLLVFEASDNWGLSQWYDLNNDPNKNINILLHDTAKRANRESALFQQVFSGTIPNDSKLYMFAAGVYLPNSPRSFEIHEKNPVRVVVEATSSPIIGSLVLDSIQIKLKYHIYSDGKIYISSVMHVLKDVSLNEWRNSVVGLNDPTYLTRTDSGNSGRIIGRSLTDISKKWTADKWRGFKLIQPGFNSWEIIGNSASSVRLGKQLSGSLTPTDGAYSISSRDDQFGWIRATDLQAPYVWHSEMARYLYVYWDPLTPLPYSDWTKASLLLVPSPRNPYQGKQSLHGWTGFKRFYYQKTKMSLKRGEAISQHYYLQLGAKGSAMLPDIAKGYTAERYAADYLGDHPVKIKSGAMIGNGYDLEKGCYTLSSTNDVTTFIIDGSSTTRIKPVFEITGISANLIPVISLNNKILHPETDFIWHNDKKGMLLVQLLKDLDEKSTISIKPAPSVAAIGGSTALIKTEVGDIINGGNDSKLRRFAILSYANDSAEVAAWIDRRFDYKISGNKPLNNNVSWMTYFDIYGIGSLKDYLIMKDFANINNYCYENMLLHSKKNFTASVSVAFREMDRFDAFEGKNGVLKTKDSKKFLDLTTAAYKGKVPLSDTMYIGYEEPFAEVNWAFSKPGKEVEWIGEYWNGSVWVPLSISDGTAGFSINGRMSFIPPGNWKPLSINNSRKKYFVRILFKDADSFPVSSRIYGDDWLNGKSNACRGWDENASGVVNTGPLIFNPNPPADASAKFRYQARIPFWSHDHFVANPADISQIGGKNTRTWAKFAAEQIVQRASSKGYSGVMCDDGERNVARDGVKPEMTDLTAGKEWMRESIAKYKDMIGFVRETDPDLKVGVNSQLKQLVRHGDWNLAEYNTFVWKTGSAGFFDRPKVASVMAYDDYEPLPGDPRLDGLLIYQDTLDVVPGIGAAWDRGNRGPIAALSKHYIGMNSNTVFSYYSRGGYIYDETDEVFLKNGKVVHQSTDPAPMVDNVYRWATWFPAMGIDIGSPDVGGHQGGKRDTAWKKGKEIGGGPDIWRRDFTSAVVLHRPAYYNTTKAEYEGHSLPVPLGVEYYSLRADGTTGPAVKQIALRAGEGAILMKSPLPTMRR